MRDDKSDVFFPEWPSGQRGAENIHREKPQERIEPASVVEMDLHEWRAMERLGDRRYDECHHQYTDQGDG